MMILMMAVSGIAWPCAGVFHEEGTLAESDAQKVLLQQLDGAVEATYQVDYTGDAADFGWVIPVVGTVESVEDGDAELLDDLDALTDPAISWHYADVEESSGGCRQTFSSSKGAAGGDANRADTGSAELDDAQVVAEGFTGTYGWSVIEADSADALMAWLTENGWSVGDTGPAIQAYVDEGGAQFVAISLTPDEAITPDGGAPLPPVKIRYDGELRYPSTMAADGPMTEVRTTIYVAGDGTAELASGWTSSPLGTLYGDIDDNPDTIWLDALRALGEQSAFGLVDTSGISLTGSRWITRFDTLAPPSAHAADAVFRITDSGDTAQTRIWLEEGYSAAALWLLTPLLGWGLRRRR